MVRSPGDVPGRLNGPYPAGGLEVVSKDEILKLIERLPDDVTEGRAITHAQMKERVAQGRKSAGR